MDAILPHPSRDQLESQLDFIRQAPADEGRIELIICRPGANQRQELDTARLSCEQGLEGDSWGLRGAQPDMQINLMNARAAAAIAGDRENWAPAGDQFYVDLDLSPDNLPPGTRLRLGSALLEVTAEPHLGCRKFSERFGRDAVLFVNSAAGKALNLRGINARVVVPGSVSVGDKIRVER